MLTKSQLQTIYDNNSFEGFDPKELYSHPSLGDFAFKYRYNPMMVAARFLEEDPSETNQLDSADLKATRLKLKAEELELKKLKAETTTQGLRNIYQAQQRIEDKINDLADRFDKLITILTDRS